MTTTDEIKRLLAELTPEHRLEVFRFLRQEFPIHPIELRLNTDAEIILEAISRASDLTLRGIRGVIAEAAFAKDVVSRLEGWQDVTPPGDASFDFALDDGNGTVRVQVKLQRQKQHRPMLSEEAPRWAALPPHHFVVETQRTRGGTTSDGEATRPYRFSEFDILAVSLHPSTGDWSSFMFSVGSWLVPHPDNPAWIQKYQAVSPVSNEFWTNDFLRCVTWLRSNLHRRLPHSRN